MYGSLDFSDDVVKVAKRIALPFIPFQNLVQDVITIRYCFDDDLVDVVSLQSLPFMELERKQVALP
jgi:hypothetical protein